MPDRRKSPRRQKPLKTSRRRLAPRAGRTGSPEKTLTRRCFHFRCHSEPEFAEAKERPHLFLYLQLPLQLPSPLQLPLQLPLSLLLLLALQLPSLLLVSFF